MTVVLTLLAAITGGGVVLLIAAMWLYRYLCDL